MKNASFWLFLLAAWLFGAGWFFLKNQRLSEKTNRAQSAQIDSLNQKLATQKTDTVHLFAENTGQLARVVEQGKTATIFFPDNEATRLNGQSVDVFFKKFCGKYSSGSQQIHLVGHTDDLGTPENNLDLGWLRARAVRKILCDCGFDEARFLVSSKGETEPLLPNSDEMSRLQNRRVVLTIIDKKTEK